MISVDIDLIGVPAFVVDVVQPSGDLRFSGVNDIHETMSGIPSDQIVGRSPRECLPPSWAAWVEARYRTCIETKGLQEYDEELEMPAGRRWWRTTLRPQLDDRGQVIRILGVAVDITERKRMENALENAVYVDHLTGVSNRRRLELAVDDAIAAAVYTGSPFSLVVVDLDGFKGINDEFGHRRGDDVLRHVASLLSMATRTTDTIARIGGDEFAIKLSATSEPELASVVTLLRRFLDRKIEIGGMELQVGLSIGAALWQPGQTFEDLLSVADSNMYREKALRRAI